MHVDINGYARLVTQKAVDEMMIGLAIGVSTVKMAAAEGLVLKAVEIDGDGMHTEIDLIEQDIKVPLQLTVVGSETRSLETVVVHLVCCLAIFAFEDEYPLILYRKYFQLL